MFGTSLDEETRHYTATHEAAHVVAAYNFRWRVDHEGVEIDERQYAGFRGRDSEAVCVIVSLAGWMGEMLAFGAPDHDDADLMMTIEAVHREDDDFEGDDYSVFLKLLTRRPHASDEELIALYRAYQHETKQILQSPDRWAAVQGIADALLLHGKLDHAQAWAIYAREGPLAPEPLVL